MAIGGPEAIDAASLATAAQRRTAPKRLCCFARNDGVAGRGRKLRRRRCRIGDRGVADLRPDQPIEEAVLERLTRQSRSDGEAGDAVATKEIAAGTYDREHPLSRSFENQRPSIALHGNKDIRLSVSPWRYRLRDLAQAFCQDDTPKSVEPNRSFPRSVRRSMRRGWRSAIQPLARPGRSDAFSPARGPDRSKRVSPSPPTASARLRRRRLRR